MIGFVILATAASGFLAMFWTNDTWADGLMKVAFAGMFFLGFGLLIVENLK